MSLYLFAIFMSFLCWCNTFVCFLNWAFALYVKFYEFFMWYALCMLSPNPQFVVSSFCETEAFYFEVTFYFLCLFFGGIPKFIV